MSDQWKIDSIYWFDGNPYVSADAYIRATGKSARAADAGQPDLQELRALTCKDIFDAYFGTQEGSLQQSMTNERGEAMAKMLNAKLARAGQESSEVRRLCEAAQKFCDYLYDRGTFVDDGEMPPLFDEFKQALAAASREQPAPRESAAGDCGKPVFHRYCNLEKGHEGDCMCIGGGELPAAGPSSTEREQGECSTVDDDSRTGLLAKLKEARQYIQHIVGHDHKLYCRKDGSACVATCVNGRAVLAKMGAKRGNDSAALEPAWNGSERKRLTAQDNKNWKPWTRDDDSPLKRHG